MPTGVYERTSVPEETRKKISASLKKRFANPENHPCYGRRNPSAKKLPHLFKKGNIPWIKGKKQSPEHVMKKSKSCRRHSVWSLENFDDGYIDKSGRMRVFVPDHPKALSHGRGYVHRAVVAYEVYHNRRVKSGCIVHHRNGDKLDDSKENLEEVTCSQHNLIHKPNIKPAVKK